MDTIYNPKLERSVSLTDRPTSSVIRDAIERDLTVPADKRKHRFFLDLPRHDFVLPSMTRFDDDFRKLFLTSLVDFGLMQELEEARCLNWCPTLPKFLPLKTLGDGNCLMHAASLGMWAVHDRRLTLRKCVYQVLIEDHSEIYRKRWQQQQQKRLEDQHGGPVDCSPEQWNEEWRKTVELASTIKSAETCAFLGLEEVHIFALSNVLHRPVLVICDDIHRGNYDESLAEVNLGGIYLPLLSNPADCIKSPLLIGYHQGHFTALVTTEDGSMSDETVFGVHRRKNAVALVKHNNTAQPVHFLLPDEQIKSDQLLKQYLSCTEEQYEDGRKGKAILVARMQSQEPEAHLENLFKTYLTALQEVYLEKAVCEFQSLPGRSYGPHSMMTTCYPETVNSRQRVIGTSTYPQTSSKHESLPCCRTHKKCLTSGCQNYATQPHDLCHCCLKKKSHFCSSPGCIFVAHPDNEGLCSKCFARFHALMDQERAMVVPSAPPRDMYECATENCHKNACAELHGMCSDCYVNSIRLSNINAGHFKAESKPSEAKMIMHDVDPELRQTHGKLNQTMPPRVSLCPHDEMRYDLPSQFYDMECTTYDPPGSSNDVATFAASRVNTVFSICNIPDCTMPAVTYHGHLCLKHYRESLHSSHQSKHNNMLEPKSSQAKEGTLCITPGCKFFGLADHSYLCSQCHAKALQQYYDIKRSQELQNKGKIEWPVMCEKLVSRNSELCQCLHCPLYCQTYSTAKTTSSSPPSPNPRRRSPPEILPCATRGCPRFGTKDKDGLCENCFKKQERLLSQGLRSRNRLGSSP